MSTEIAKVQMIASFEEEHSDQSNQKLLENPSRLYSLDLYHSTHLINDNEPADITEIGGLFLISDEPPFFKKGQTQESFQN
ncbi:hypothetical protein Trydic_g3064 [Trypoxylus dichotomus]